MALTLEQARANIGRGVVYHPTPTTVEQGVITGVGQMYVYVRYKGDQTAKATAPEQLDLDERRCGMTAPDLPTWTVAPDPNTSEDTLWFGSRSVVRRSDLRRVMAPSDADGLFDVWVRALAPDEATVLSLAIAAHENYPLLAPDMRAIARLRTRRTLAALARSEVPE